MTSHPIFIAASAPSSYFIAGLAIFGVVLLMRTTRRRAMKSRSVKAAPVRERYAQLSRESTAARALGNVMAEMDELSRQIHGRLDTKIAKLEILIRDADARIAKLSRLEKDRSAGAPELTGASGRSGLSGSVDVTLESESPLEFQELDTSHDLSAPGAGEAAPQGDAHGAIHALADRGLTPEQIAVDVSRPVGEIELILSLRHSAGSSSRA